MNRWRSWIALTAGVALLAGCGAGASGQNGSMQNYKDTKSMVIDILKSEEGQKAVQEALHKGSTGIGGMRLLNVQEEEQLQIAVKDIMTDPHYSENLRNMMLEPKFAGDFAKAISKENKQLHKELMKDPEYQTMLLDVMKNPEYEKMLLDVMKGKAFRQQTMTIIQDALNNPLFKAQLLELMTKAIEEHTRKMEEKTETENEDQDK